jgi:DNA-binding transcriptional LysR family regulator
VTIAPVRPPGPVQAGLPVDETDLVLLRAIAGNYILAAAARTAGLSPKAANRRLDRLEHRLDLELVHRDTSQVAPTAAGRRVLAAGGSLLAAIAAAAQATVDAATGGRPDLPRLRLAGFGTNWDTFADDLATGLPGVLLEVTVAEPAAAAELYDRRQVDVVYAWQAGDETVPMARPAQRRTVVDEPLWVALPLTHPSAADPVVPLGRLVTDRWLTGTTDQAARLVHTAGATAGFVPRAAQPVGSAPAARSMVAQGLGVTLVSPLATPPGPGALLVHRPLTDPPRRRLVLVYDPAVVADRLARLVVHRLRRHYAATAAVRNPGYRARPDFPVPRPDPADPAFDPALLAGIGGCDEAGRED